MINMNQNSSGQLRPQDQINESEISLLDALIFFKRSYKLIVLIGILGVVTSFVYLLITPKQYRASAQIQMAQIGVTNNFNPLGVNIEEPTLLIARLSSPASYTAEITKSCGLDIAKDVQEVLSKSVKLTIPKGVANVVDLKIIGASPEASINCAQAVFDLIKTTQAQIIKPYIEEAKAKLLDNQERLAKAQDLIMKADKSGSAMGAAYLSTRDEIRFLLDEITALKNVVATNDNRATRLVAPIYVSEDPVAPKKRITLLAGLFGGLFLGLLIAIGRQIIPSLKAQLENNTHPT
jgi:LPS O-antigen subunit length determinant protein (WzzB/FepE family)